MHRFSMSGLLSFAVVACGCSSEPLVRSLTIVTGLEADTFTASPAVTNIRIEARTTDGKVFATDAVPGGTFDLGEVPQDEPLAIDVTGTSVDGLVVVRGRSLSGVLPSAFASEDVPVFVQRVGTWSRPPGALDRAHVDAPACVLGERFVATTGGSTAKNANGDADASIGDFYDLLAWSGAASTTFPVIAGSLVGRYDGLLAVGDSAANFVTADASPTSVPLPSGLASFADVAEGIVVEAPSGTSYVIGATRSGTATRGVLGFGSDGLVTGLALVQARSGAASAWAEGVGVIVAAGSTTGAGFEVLPEGQTLFVARDMPPDATTGAAAVTLGKGRMALIGGITEMNTVAPTRTWDPSCASGCTMTEVPGAELPVALVGTRGFYLGGARVLVVGSDTTAAKLMRVFEVDIDKPLVTERPLREARSGAAVSPAPNGTLLIMGGLHEDGTPAMNVEMFFP